MRMRNVVVVLKEVMLVAVMENHVLVMVHACYPTLKRTNKDNMREKEYSINYQSIYCR